MKKRIYKPIRERVIVRVDKTELKSDGGIILEASEREKDAREFGTVLALGSRVFFDTDGIQEELKIGDKVLFSRYAGKTCEKVNGIEIRVMKDIDICCIIEEIEE